MDRNTGEHTTPLVNFWTIRGDFGEFAQVEAVLHAPMREAPDALAIR